MNQVLISSNKPVQSTLKRTLATTTTTTSTAVTDSSKCVVDELQEMQAKSQKDQLVHNPLAYMCLPNQQEIESWIVKRKQQELSDQYAMN